MNKFYSFVAACFVAACTFTAEAEETNVTNRYIKNPSFENGFTSWTQTNMQTQTNTNFTKKAGTIYVEKWVDRGSKVGSCEVYQTLSSLPAGSYRLTVTAQNIQQDSPTAAQTGAYIYAGSSRTTVSVVADYSVEFSTLGASVNIGFKAVSATGNWICVDNFRLYYLGVDTESMLTALQDLIADAETTVAKAIQPSFKLALQSAINAAKALTSDSEESVISDAATALSQANEAAKTNASAMSALKTASTKAKGMLQRNMAAIYKNTLQTVYEEALVILNENGDADINDVATRLDAAITDAQASYDAYLALNRVINTANNINKTDKKGVDELLAAIEAATIVLQGETSTPEQMEEAKVALESATLMFRVTNGTGTAPKAITNTSFIIPAAHGALIRASFSGNNILESGICWSTDKEPQVSDNRSTDYYTLNGNIYHIKTMQPASIYYARAYAISKTYAVGYGDVVKVVTLPKGTCVGTWDNKAPSAEANQRCSNAIQETMDYLNEWTAIKGFTLSGHYGADTPTADCSYGGWMRIGPNAGNQAIGTVIHETGHGVGVGTHWRWNSCTDTRESEGKYGKWLGSWTNKTFQFLENKYTDDYYFKGDAVHGWGNNASYDWFVNGADKDTHTALQYIGGCTLLYSLYVDGLCPTSGYANGVPGYTYDFDDETKYYIKSENEERGLYDGFLCQNNATSVVWKQIYKNHLNDSCAWYIEYVPATGYYRFKNVATGRYLSHPSSINMQNTSSPGANQNFQLMPGRKTLLINNGSRKYSTMSYWFTWTTNGENKSMSVNAFNERLNYGTVTTASFNYSDAGGTAQRYIILAEDEIDAYEQAALPTGIQDVNKGTTIVEPSTGDTYDLSGRKVRNDKLHRGIYIVNGQKKMVK